MPNNQPTYQAPSYDSIYDNPQYQSGMDLLGQQQTNAQNTLQGQLGTISSQYDVRRGDLIRSYQDAIDSINSSLRQTGIGIRGDYAGRNLYDPNGQVSGLGQGYAAGVLDPIYNTLQQTQSRQGQDINNLAIEQGQEMGGVNQQLANLGTDYASQQQTLANNIYSMIQQAAQSQFQNEQSALDSRREGRRLKMDQRQARDARKQERYGRRQTIIERQRADEDESYQRELNDPRSRTYNEARGREYLGSMDKVQDAIRKYGRDAVTNVGGNYYLTSPEERQNLGLLGSGTDPLGIL